MSDIRRAKIRPYLLLGYVRLRWTILKRRGSGTKGAYGDAFMELMTLCNELDRIINYSPPGQSKILYAYII